MGKILNAKELSEFSGEREEYLYQMLNSDRIGASKKIALYGLGKHTEKLLRFFGKHAPALKERICCLIDREKENINVGGYAVLSLEDAIRLYQIDCVIISSYRFQDEIYERICEIEKDNIIVYKIYDGLAEEAMERIYLYDDVELQIKKNIWSEEIYYGHINRYYWALSFCIHKNVLDIACGCGYGTEIIAEEANMVTGVDISELSIAYAKKHFNRNNTEFICNSIYDINLDVKFDVITSFETIEHIDDEGKYFETIDRHLNTRGIALISTPYSERDGKSDINEWHINEYTVSRFQKVLGNVFHKVIFYRQELDGRCPISIDDGSMMDAQYEKTVILAVCFKGE